MSQERIFEFETVLDDQESDDELSYLEVDQNSDHLLQVTEDVDDHVGQQHTKYKRHEQDEVEVEDEEAAELRELLESMTEEERSEFLRLSRSETLSTNVLGLGVAR